MPILAVSSVFGVYFACFLAVRILLGLTPHVAVRRPHPPRVVARRPFFVLSMPNKDREGSERVPEGFPKGWEGIPAGVEGI